VLRAKTDASGVKVEAGTEGRRKRERDEDEDEEESKMCMLLKI